MKKTFSFLILIGFLFFSTSSNAQYISKIKGTIKWDTLGCRGIKPVTITSTSTSLLKTYNFDVILSTYDISNVTIPSTISWTAVGANYADFTLTVNSTAKYNIARIGVSSKPGLCTSPCSFQTFTFNPLPNVVNMSNETCPVIINLTCGGAVR